MLDERMGGYRIQVDVEATRNWYDLYGEPAGGCDCAYCRNFTAAVETLPPEVGDFLARMGLDLRRPGDASECGPAEGGRLYTPLWHLAGRLLEEGEGPLLLAQGVRPGLQQARGRFSGTSRSPFSSAAWS